MSDELLIGRLQHDVQTLKEKVGYLEKEIKEVKKKSLKSLLNTVNASYHE